MRWRRVLWLILLLTPAVLFSDDASLSPDQQTLRAAGLASDANALLDFFRKRTPGAGSRAEVADLVRRLGEKSFAARERAFNELVRYGPAATEALTAALNDPDLEIASRAERCLHRIAENGSEVAVAVAAARLLARQKPPGACDVLLAFLSSTGDTLVMEEVRTTLSALAVRNGQPEPLLVAALADRSPVRRAAAAEAFLRAGVADLRPTVRKLLHDPEATVRLRVGLALAASGEREAVGVLIDLLAELPLEQAFLAEDVLLRLADEQAPPVALGRSADPPEKVRAVWREWWGAHAAAVDLEKLRQGRLGRILIAQWDNGQLGRVLELDGTGKTLWQVENLPWPLDAQLLPGNRLLLTEFYENRVAERNFRGELLWQQALTENPIAAQRLPNGNTFIATRAVLREVDRGGKEVYAHRPSHLLLAAQKGRDGTFSCITSEGVYLHLDAAGKEVRRFPVHAQNYCGFEVLPGGRVLVPQEGRNQVVEFRADGKPVWTVSVSRPIAAARLPNGNVLAASRDGQRVVELDVAGRSVREYKCGGYPWRARFR